MRVIHFFIDEKFTDFVLHLFETCECDQQYVLVKASKDQKINFHHEKLNYILINEVNSLVNKTNPHLIIFHSLFGTNLSVLNELKTKAVVSWFSWGGDIALDAIKAFKSVHEPKTLKHYYGYNITHRARNGFWNTVKTISPAFFNGYYKLRTGTHWQNYLQIKNLHKVSFVNTVTYAEQKLFTKNNYHGKFTHIPIGTIELLLDGVEQSFAKKEHHTEPVVFLGHSAYSENNHFDVLHTLHEHGFKGEIICPLSYGDVKYAEKVSAKGKELFDGKFIPVREYLTKKNYYDLMAKADCYINNSIIQQGLGNILVALYMGKKVVLNHKGEVYRYLREMGIETATIKNTLEWKKLEPGNQELSDVRKKIDAVYSEENVRKKINTFLAAVANE